MKAPASSFAVGLLLSIALPAGVALASDPGEQLMLERSNYWRAQHRLDLARDILNKILTHNPAQPDALYQQAALAMEQGDRGGAQQYFDRLRQLAPADRRAAELVLTASQPPAAQPAAALPAAASPGKVSEPPVPIASAGASVVPAAAKAVAPPPELVVASADSDDLLPARSSPASQPASTTPRMIAAMGPVESPLTRQLASLPPNTVSDADASIPLTASAVQSAGSADLGITARTVQMSQVELQPPQPVGGYQTLGNLKPYSPSDTLEINIERDLTRLQLQANPTLVAGFGYRTHSGTEGTSKLTEFGAPVEVSFSPGFTGTARIAVLPVYLDAGTPANGNLTTFGANPIQAAVGLPNATARGQNATGVGILGSYTLGEFSGQIGTTPLGFPITNVVGNLAYSPRFFGDTVGVRFEALRQPVTDSVLSYAGSRANLSAANAAVPAFTGDGRWGGVVKTGGHVTAFWDDQTYGAYGGAGVAWLTGTHVADNAVVDALLGAYFRPWKTDDWALRVGVSLYYTGYDKNLGGFTYGQGGYFSPQDFEGLGFPIEFTGHSGPWSYLASATIGVQHFNSRSSQVYPNDRNAQAALQFLSPTTAFTTGTHSTGVGFNLKGQLEYAIDPTLAVGVAASLDNGNGYDEGIGKLYLRKTFDWFAPVASKNDPIAIAARDRPTSRL